ncbi:MAG: prepilin-type N-terminal cleavage/methylation domain-containing protein [Cyanothece sp. SIO2G6]|nr:prepilin-type N-terminal cleavage/methylation domain-containing protein [Cyanothece sp. SIO2G6]
MAYFLLSRLLAAEWLCGQSHMPIQTTAKQPHVQGGQRATTGKEWPSAAGFSILEIIVVVAIIGVLAAIAAPSWLTLVNRQRLGSARDEVLQAIRSAQGAAKQTRRPELLEFDVSGDLPRVEGIELGSGNLEPNMIAMTVTDGAGNDISDIEFDQHGAISQINNNPDALNWPIKIVITTSSGVGPKRCIFVDSLLVSTRLESDRECD